MLICAHNYVYTHLCSFTPELSEGQDSDCIKGIEAASVLDIEQHYNTYMQSYYLFTVYSIEQFVSMWTVL